ncbi:winged helix-turn-helix domain-containing protein [Catenuloplanes japonicus]|uniref:winged helix-turn-helix domain-containing protein n=1 Tax=Catenuloplanes japonicus TaxID=33876 RepID=UPI0007C59F3E|nr:winged helix-turn-helix domain-containing protein [Catenuloplanes japonicus]
MSDTDIRPVGRGQPKYEQLLNRIRDQILRGELLPGAKLPSSRTLESSYEASPGTITRAMLILEQLRYIEGRPGDGRYVRPPTDWRDHARHRLPNPDSHDETDTSSLPPDPEVAHPVPLVSDILAVCRRTGLTVEKAPHGLLWGWVKCATGARAITVLANPPDAPRHASQLLAFQQWHASHRAPRQRGQVTA